MSPIGLFTHKPTILIKPQSLGHEISKGLNILSEEGSKANDLKRLGHNVLISAPHNICQKLFNCLHQELPEEKQNSSMVPRFYFNWYETPEKHFLNFFKPPSQRDNRYNIDDLNKRLLSSDTLKQTFRYLNNLIATKASNALSNYHPGYARQEGWEFDLKGKTIAGIKVQLWLELALLKLACQKLFSSKLTFRNSAEFITTLRNLVKNNIKIITGLATVNLDWEGIIYKTIGSHEREHIDYQFKPKFFALDLANSKTNKHELDPTIIPKKSLVDTVVKKLKTALPKSRNEETLGCPALKMRVTKPDGTTQNLVEMVHDWFCKILETTLYPWLEKNSVPGYLNLRKRLDFSH